MPALAEPLHNVPNAQNLWENALRALSGEGKTYAVSWLERVVPMEVREGTLVLAVPEPFMRDWVEDHYGALLEEIFTRLLGAPLPLRYEVVPGVPRLPPSEPILEVNSEGARQDRLNARFTFDSYVVADSNQLPAAAAAAVADAPGHCYNPLFIYGGTGLGKTHLLHAVGNQIRQKDPSARVLYLSSEEFTNEYIDGVREHRMQEFRRKFRDECDVLLIDDIQFLGKREETQKEFFYTFNTLHERSKAIVLTADTTPAEIPGLEERLRSRFAMGLITDIQEPNFETRVAILQTKAKALALDLPVPVAHFVARHILRNVRELEGALVKVSAVQSLTGEPVTEPFVASVLKDILPAYQPIDLDSIQREVARYYKVPAEELRGDRRTKQVAHARSVAMYLCRKHTKSSFPEIGKQFGKDHSTVISAVRKVERLREAEIPVRRELEELESKLGVVR